MSLSDSLLLDPYPFDVYIAKRTDGAKGSGTMNDPWDGSTSDRLDDILNTLDTSNGGVTVHLGPGEFTTKGYADGITPGWRALSYLRILGAGVDITTLELEPPTTSGKHYFAVGHPLVISGSNEPDTVDFFELSDLTINCNLDNSIDVACGAVRVMGSHVRIKRVKFTQWGNRVSTLTGFVCAVITGHCNSGELTEPIGRAECANAGIDDCIAVEPATNTGQAGTMLIFHIGDTAVPVEGIYAEEAHVRGQTIAWILLKNPRSLFAGIFRCRCLQAD